MKSKIRKIGLCAGVLTVVFGMGVSPMTCGSQGAAPSSNTSDSGNGNNGGGVTTFSADDIVGVWNTPCTAQTDPIAGATHYQAELQLISGGYFSYTQSWFNGTCVGANYAYIFETFGNYTVGGLVSGSSTLQTIDFDYTINNFSSPDLQVMATNTVTRDGIETAFNNDCGLTSPYCTDNSGTCSLNDPGSGVGESVYQMLCQHYTLPNQGSGGVYETASNVVSFSAGLLTLGASPIGVPGVFSNGSLPGSATIEYTN